MKRWRIAEFHPEDRYEPADEACDQIRSELRSIESKIKLSEPKLLNQFFLERRRLQIELAERLYGK